MMMMMTLILCFWSYRDLTKSTNIQLNEAQKYENKRKGKGQIKSRLQLLEDIVNVAFVKNKRTRSKYYYLHLFLLRIINTSFQMKLL